MGLRNSEYAQQKKAEEEARIKKEAKDFDKTFTDKTYSVAKKVMENVEKVSNYDYEKLFERVKTDIEEKINTDGPNIKVKVNLGHESARTKGAKDKTVIISKPPKGFIRDAKSRADYINKVKAQIQEELSDDNINFETVHVTKDQVTKDDGLVHAEQITEEEPHSKDVDPVKDIEDNLVKDVEALVEDIQDDINNLSAEHESALLEQADIIEELVVEDKHHQQKPLRSTIDIDNIVDQKLRAYEEQVHRKNQTNDHDQLMDSEGQGDAQIEEIEGDQKIESSTEGGPVTYHVDLDDALDPRLEAPVTDLASTDEPLENLQDHETGNKNPTRVYNKENQAHGNRYYRKKRREKFAKKMKVELDDNIINKKRRSLTRLFKFSLAFKLSFVYIFLMVLTIVTLSVGFYLGIDYVVQLKDAGKLEDIMLFKNVLVVLLVLFNMAAILLCISVGSKASRNLVKPLDEMTKIVQQINGEAMDRRLNVKGMHDELKELALTFNEMLERIELAYETQNRFTSDASHELRTPIAVIQGYVNMLDRWGKADSEVLEESIEAIKSEANNMKRLTEKLLLLAKADKGILEMSFEEFSLKDLIDEITKETVMIDSNHDITNEINSVDLILGDRPSLKQALRIFVDNAVKYTPEGGRIAINAYERKKGVYIEISDNGIGISEEDMKQVFNRFYRADPSRTKASGGHGLGLSIAKWIIKEHKGELEIKSEVNKGTVVTIFLGNA